MSNSQMSTSHLVCECGCGEIREKPDRMTMERFLSQKYKHGHFYRDPRNKADKIEKTKKAWANGKFIGRNMEKTLARMDDMRSKIDRVAAAKKTSDRLKGTHGQGRWKIGLIDHASAKKWIIRSPHGKTYRFSNLMEWARRNEMMFEDDRKSSKTPFSTRIAGGIKQLGLSNGRSCSYKGWVMVSKQEYIIEGMKDPLEREVKIRHKKPRIR